MVATLDVHAMQSPRTARIPWIAAVLFVLGSSWTARALTEEWTYREVLLTELVLEDGVSLPTRSDRHASLRDNGAVLAAALTGAWLESGEAYLWSETRLDVLGAVHNPALTSLRLKVPADAEVRGTLFLVESGDRRAADWRIARHDFRLPDDAGECTEREFLEARRMHVAQRSALQLPGHPWFETVREDLDRLLGESERTEIEGPEGARESEFDTTFELFTGRRALRETLQAERLREVDPGEGEAVAIESIDGITVPAIEWAPLLDGKDPVIEPLARWVPDDQILVSFSSFAALGELVDELEQRGPALVQFVEQRGQDARTRDRLEAQLCVELTGLVRWLGPRVVRSVALTCSDPYLREGTDVTILMDTVSAEAVLTILEGQQGQRAQGLDDVDHWSGTVAGAEVQGAQTPDRRVSTFRARIDDVVVVSNSLRALERVLRTRQGQHPSHGDSDEYRFFRDRYGFDAASPSVLFFLSDAFLRRFCGPAWRVAESRRLHCASAMDRTVARRLRDGGRLAEGAGVACPSGGKYGAGDGYDVFCTEHGNTAFLTPIAETPISWVTPRERDAYEQFRERYQSFWGEVFDPVAIEIRTGETLELDLTVMPLIEGTDYTELREVSSGAGALTSVHGDPHDEALVHWILHINKDSRVVRELGSLLAMVPGSEKGPLRWMGDTFEVFVDRSEALEGLAEAEDVDAWIDEHLPEFPIAMRVPIRDPVHFGVFLVGLRAFADASSGGLLRWETRHHDEAPYVVISANSPTGFDELDDLHIYYAATGGSFYVTLSEDLLKRAMDRCTARANGQETVNHQWLGDHTALRVHLSDALPTLTTLLDPYHDEALTDCTRNFPALMEWRRMFPDEDPRHVHERLLNVRPVCPIGGHYTFDAGHGWPECSVHGHPEAPRRSRDLPTALVGIGEVGAGLTFEDQGLRLRLRVQRER